MGKVEITRVVIDTNVVVSALLFGGVPGKLVPLWKTGRIRALASKEMIEEYLRVLAYPKFELSEEEINYLLYQEILPYFEVVKTKPGPMIVEEDPSEDFGAPGETALSKSFAEPFFITEFPTHLRGMYYATNPDNPDLTRSLDLMALARANALLNGRNYVIPQDVKDLAITALGHRIILEVGSWLSGTSPDLMINKILDAVKAPRKE